MLVQRRSVLSGLVHEREIPVDPAALEAWSNAGSAAPLIQDAFPQLSEDDLEFLITGSTPEEWEAAFPEEDESEADDGDTI